MKKIDESAINSQTGMLSPSGVLQFLQDESKDAAELLTNAMVGDSYVYPDLANTAVVIQGCNQYTAGGAFNAKEGIIKYNGELFYVPVTHITTLVNTPVVVLVTSYNNVAANADPILFTDGTSRNVLQTRTMQIVDGTSGTSGYICDFSALSIIDECKLQYDLSSGSTTINSISSLRQVTSVSKNSQTLITAVVNASSATGNDLNVYIKVNGTIQNNTAYATGHLAASSALQTIYLQTVLSINRGDIIILEVNPNSTSTVIGSSSLAVNQQYIR
jgi:hypothetical protein